MEAKYTSSPNNIDQEARQDMLERDFWPNLMYKLVFYITSPIMCYP
jgi:hypothetical protein